MAWQSKISGFPRWIMSDYGKQRLLDSWRDQEGFKSAVMLDQSVAVFLGPTKAVVDCFNVSHTNQISTFFLSFFRTGDPVQFKVMGQVAQIEALA